MRDGCPEFTHAETLVFACRAAFRSGDSDVGWHLANQIVERVAGVISNAVRKCGVPPRSKDDAIRDIVSELFMVLQADTTDGDFADVRLFLFVQRRAITVAQGYGVEQRVERLDGDLAFPSQGDGIIAMIPSDTDIARDCELTAFIEGLPAHTREIVQKIVNEGLSIESQDPMARTVVSEMGITSRTVRNRLARLRKLLEEGNHGFDR